MQAQPQVPASDVALEPPPAVASAPRTLDPSSYPFNLNVCYQINEQNAPVWHRHVRGWKHSAVILKCYEETAAKQPDVGVKFPLMIPYHKCYVEFIGSADQETEGAAGGGKQVFQVIVSMLGAYETRKVQGFKPAESPTSHSNMTTWLYSMLRVYTSRDILMLYLAAEHLKIDALLRPLMYCLVANLHNYPVERARLLHVPAKMRNDVVNWNAASAMVTEVIGDVLRILTSVVDGRAVDHPKS